MLVKTKTTIETEIDINFPVHVEYANGLYKVINGTDYIKVTISDVYHDLKGYEIEVRKGYSTAANIAIEGRKIPQSQFDEAVVLALQHIHAIAFDKVVESNMGIDNDYPPIGDYRNNNVNNF